MIDPPVLARNGLPTTCTCFPWQVAKLAGIFSQKFILKRWLSARDGGKRGITAARQWLAATASAQDRANWEIALLFTSVPTGSRRASWIAVMRLSRRICWLPRARQVRAR